MPFVAAACERCDAPLNYDLKTDKWYCSYCGYISDKENITNNVTANITDLHLDGVRFNARVTVKMIERLDRAKAFLDLKKYDDAFQAFQMLSKQIPQEYLVWWGQIRAVTKDFSVELEQKSVLDELRDLYDSAMLFVPEREKARIEHQFMDYYQPLVTGRLEEIKRIEKRAAELEEEYQEISSCMDELQKMKYFTFGTIPPEIFVVPGVLILLGLFTGNGLFCIGILVVTVVCFLGLLMYEEYVSRLEEERTTVLEEFTDRRDQVSRELADIRDRRDLLNS